MNRASSCAAWKTKRGLWVPKLRKTAPIAPLPACQRSLCSSAAVSAGLSCASLRPHSRESLTAPSEYVSAVAMTSRVGDWKLYRGLNSVFDARVNSKKKSIPACRRGPRREQVRSGNERADRSCTSEGTVVPHGTRKGDLSGGQTRRGKREHGKPTKFPCSRLGCTSSRRQAQSYCIRRDSCSWDLQSRSGSRDILRRTTQCDHRSPAA